MDPPPPPITTAASKLRLMVSYNGHIVPRPTDKHLFYAAGETRIISFDRPTVSSSLSSFTSHLSRSLSNIPRPFHLKYQLPNEDLDSLISVSTDEDLANMLEEHDRVANVGSGRRERIRLFLFPVKEEGVGTETWFCDALKNTGVGEMEGRNVGGGGVQESVVMEMNSSFGSTNSSVSMSNLPPIGVQLDDGGVGLSDKKAPVTSGAKTFTIDPEITLVDPSTMVQLPKTVQLSGNQLPKQQQHEVQYVQGSASYIPQYSAAPLHPTSYYPVYQIPMPQQQNGSYSVNQPYPVYYYPVQPVPSYNMPIHNNVINSQNLGSSRPPLHPQTAAASLVNVPSGQQPISPSEHVQPIVDIASNSNELDNNIAYTQIYKTQPSVPVPSAPYPAHTTGASK